MSGNENKISYEVHILQKGSWELHASYPGTQQSQAIRDAKALEKISTVTSVKVVREEIDADSGAVQENNIFASANLPEDQQPKGKIEAQKNPTAKPKPAAKKSPVRKKPAKPSTEMKAGAKIPRAIQEFDPDGTAGRTSLINVVVKLLLVVLFGAVIASLITGMASIWLRESSFGINTQTNILFALFVVSFTLSLISMSLSFLPRMNLNRSGKSNRNKEPKATLPKAPPPPVKRQDDPLPEQFRKDAEEAAREHREESEGDDEEDTEEDQDNTAPWIEEQQQFVMDYLQASLKEGSINKEQLDNFNKFGVNLFIAGACETLSQDRQLDEKTLASVISEPVQFMGFKRRDAESFPNKIQSYLLADSKYMQVYQAGCRAMKSYLAEDSDATTHLNNALEEWNKPKETGDSSAPVTVLFTDIAGSTSMTQTKGDAIAQQVVRAHNRIVRETLGAFNGKEIKHTGDGIMASFASTSNAVEAAADMQQGTLKHNASNPDLPLGLKIGLNAGEPIAEENDLYGTTVQLAARIVDKAQASQIFVSETVVGMCGGKKYTFIKHGPFNMKGFDDGLYLHEFIWNKDAAQPEPTPEVEVETDVEAETVVEMEQAPDTDPEAEAEAEAVSVPTDGEQPAPVDTPPEDDEAPSMDDAAAAPEDDKEPIA